MSFAPKIAVVVDNHSLLAIRTSDVVEGNISAYLLDNEPSDDEGRIAVNRLLLQGVVVDNLSIRCCTGSRWEPLDRMSGCLVALVTYVLHADGVVVAVVLSVVQHNVSHVDIGEQMTNSKTAVLYTFRSAENYQPITNEWSLESRGRAENNFVENIFVDERR